MTVPLKTAGLCSLFIPPENIRKLKVFRGYEKGAEACNFIKKENPTQVFF